MQLITPVNYLGRRCTLCIDPFMRWFFFANVASSLRVGSKYIYRHLRIGYNVYTPVRLLVMKGDRLKNHFINEIIVYF